MSSHDYFYLPLLRTLCFLWACIASFPVGLRAQSSEDGTCADWSRLPRIIGHTELRGEFPDMVVRPPIAYLASDSGVTVFDITSPESPVILRRIDLGAPIRGIAVDGSRAYASTWKDFWVMTLEDATNPIPRGHLDVPEGYGVAARGTIAFVTTRDRVKVIDASNPDAPEEVVEFSAGGFVQRLAVDGDLLFVLDSLDGLLFVDIHDPRAPIRVGQLTIDDGFPSAVHVFGGTAYLGVSRGYGKIGSLWTIDFSNPASPQVLGRADTWGPSVHDLAGTPDHALVLTGFCDYQCGGFSLQLFDTTDPANPRGVSDVRITGIAEKVTSTPAGALVLASTCNPYRGGCDDPGGLSVVTIPDFKGSALGERAELPQGGYLLAVKGDRGVASDGRGVATIDLSDPTRPRTVGWVRSPVFLPDVQGVAVDGNLACVAADTFGVLVVDISMLDQPRIVTLHYTPGRARGVALRGSHAFLADGSGGLQILDLTDLRVPRYVGHLSTPGSARALALQGDYAYLVDTQQLLIVDVQQPEEPRIVGHFDAQGVWNVAVEGSRVFATSVWPDWKIYVLDVSDPAAPLVLNRWDHLTSDPVLPFQGLLYLPNTFQQRITVVDFSDAASPKAIGQCDYGGFFYELIAGEAYLYASAGVHGRNVIQVMKPHCEDPVSILEWNFGGIPAREGIALTWNVRRGTVSWVHVNRAPHGSSHWTCITASALPVAGPTHFLDSSAQPGAAYDYQLEGIGTGGTRAFSPIVSLVATGEAGLEVSIPSPARGPVDVHIRLGGRESVSALVHDIRGRVVRHLDWGVLGSGAHSVVWDTRDDRGRPVAAGLYFVRVVASSRTRDAKAVVVR